MRNINVEHDIFNARREPENKCHVCGESFEHPIELRRHAKDKLHLAYVCDVSGCDYASVSLTHLITHKSHSHIADHRQVIGDVPFACLECKEAFHTQTQLQAHANTHQHSPFACVCSKTFARVDVLNRHIDSFSKDIPKFPCSYCKGHRGKDGFRRKDHLVQHLRGYHKFDSEEIRKECPEVNLRYLPDVFVCPLHGCESHPDEDFRSLDSWQQVEQAPFKTRAEYSKHMREVHDETPFPCIVFRCDRVGAKGYLRAKDLKKHISGKHPGVGEYVPKTHHEYTCDFDGCGHKSWSPFELWKHGWIHRS